MRTVFLGAGEVSVATAKALIHAGHDVVIIELDQAKIDDLAETLDCSFLHGDGARPDILREVNPARTDVLFCLTNNDQANVIASLVGRSLGFKRVITSIADSEYEGICRELGLKDTIIPSLTISRYLEDMVTNKNASIELSSVIKDEARLFSFIVREPLANINELRLPSQARAICCYREGQFMLVNEATQLLKDDELVILTHSKNVPELEQRWQPPLVADELNNTASPPDQVR